MREIRESRVQGSRTLVEWLRHRPQRPSVLIAASGISFYGDRGDEVLPESAGPGPVPSQDLLLCCGLPLRFVDAMS